MVGVPLSALLLKFVLYQLHKTLGILALVLTTARLLVRARGGRPAWGADMPGWQRRPASVTHGLLYALLVAAPVLGYLTAATAPARVSTLFLGVIPVPHLVGPAPGWFSRLGQVHRGVAALLAVLARACRGGDPQPPARTRRTGPHVAGRGPALARRTAVGAPSGGRRAGRGGIARRRARAGAFEKLPEALTPSGRPSSQPHMECAPAAIAALGVRLPNSPCASFIRPAVK